jgi:hypothetical protein
MPAPGQAARKGFGTNIRRVADTRRLAKALTSAGIDPRQWASYGTVCTVGDDGECDFSDKRAVYVGPEGVEVDVVLEPLRIPVVAHYAGIQGGCETTFYTPIRPGDRVLLVLPDGDPNLPPVITNILHSADCKVPIADGKPIFKNDRVLLYAENVDVDLRTKGGTQVEVKQDGAINVNVPTLLGKVNLGRADAVEQLILGTTYRGQEATMNGTIMAALTAITAAYAAWVAPAAEGSVAPPGAFRAAYPGTSVLIDTLAGPSGAAAILAAIVAFEAQALTYLSTITRSK